MLVSEPSSDDVGGTDSTSRIKSLSEFCNNRIHYGLEQRVRRQTSMNESMLKAYLDRLDLLFSRQSLDYTRYRLDNFRFL